MVEWSIVRAGPAFVECPTDWAVLDSPSELEPGTLLNLPWVPRTKK